MSTSYFAAAGPHVSIAPEAIFHVGSVPITNSMLLGAVGYTLIIFILVSTLVAVKRGSRNLAMHAVLWMFETMYETVVEVTGSVQKAKRLAPLAITLFFLIVFNNWLGLVPGVGSITYHGEPLFRGLAADMNFTFALAIISMLTVQVYAIRQHGLFGNLRRYIHNPLKDPAHAFEGMLEFLAEFSRGTALSMRLFGNVFGGEVLLGVISYITSYGAPLALPVFMVLELFVGAVQAYVFFMLTVVFISLGSSGHDEDHANEGPEDDVTTPTVSPKEAGATSG
ncbi:MAG TPA: F0F1 ATP synthase subunit A [Candidatus Saccharimonadales bacterium]|nr:F0F1 ATP synthase subunit A [Candidatus Saccharimonadales bacterium]